ncbi:four helix bundle protein [Myroides odoratimimus]|uniref:Uncharacterized protein n=1 Tax=Myroides odoratimimus CIP 101113 TaxID=883154 RepID=A0AAV3F2A9_9FLAO|nr:hypothetical protein [Myroides odoratimimus]EHO09527.1 hypothetical protein HMPREF9715_02371 [Myroides odoratimimus CIP 101113]
MSFVSVYQRDVMLIKSLELKLTIYKLTLENFKEDHLGAIAKMREISGMISLYIGLGLKSQIEEDFVCYLDDISHCCMTLEKQILLCGQLGFLINEDIVSLLDLKNIIFDFVGKQLFESRTVNYYRLLHYRFT